MKITRYTGSPDSNPEKWLRVNNLTETPTKETAYRITIEEHHLAQPNEPTSATLAERALPPFNRSADVKASLAWVEWSTADLRGDFEFPQPPPEIRFRLKALRLYDHESLLSVSARVLAAVTQPNASAHPRAEDERKAQ